MPFELIALKRYNGAPLGLNQHTENGLHCNAGEKQKEIFYVSDSRVSEPTHASAVGVPMTHTEKLRLHTIRVCHSL